MNEKKITYLVDTENINTCWINIFKNMEKTDEMLLFYTENTPYLSYEYMNDLLLMQRKPEMIKCRKGKNALDFQLVSHLGYLIHTDRTRTYIIVTKDKEYGVVAEYWTEKGFQVHCSAPEELEVAAQRQEICVPQAEEQKKELKRHKEQKKTKEEKRRKIQKSTNEEKTVEDEKQIKIPKKKKEKNLRSELGELLPKEWKKKDKKLLPQLECFIQENEKMDKETLHNRLIQNWGAEKGGQIYAVLKTKLDKLYEK